MKVIKLRSLTNDWPKRCVCEECGTELEYMPDDVYIGWMGVEYVACPECGCKNMVGDERKAKPTWPFTFYHAYKENGAKYIDDDTIAEMVDTVVEPLQSSKKDWDFAMRATGDTMVWGWKHKDGIDIYVAKDYWQDIIFND